VKRDYIGTASKGEGARENKKYLSKRERQGKQPQDWRKSLTGGKASVDQGGLEPSIYRLRTLRSAD